MGVKAQPDRYHTVVPYLIVPDAAKCIDFLTRVFGAKEEGGRIPAPGGKIGHTELRIGDSIIMLADGNDQYPPRNAMLHFYVADVDAAYKRGLEAGAASLRPPSDQFYGDRVAGLDAFGVYWSIATHVEDVSSEEMQRRAKAMFPG